MAKRSTDAAKSRSPQAIIEEARARDAKPSPSAEKLSLSADLRSDVVGGSKHSDVAKGLAAAAIDIFAGSLLGALVGCVVALGLALVRFDLSHLASSALFWASLGAILGSLVGIGLAISWTRRLFRWPIIDNAFVGAAVSGVLFGIVVAIRRWNVGSWDADLLSIFGTAIGLGAAVVCLLGIIEGRFRLTKDSDVSIPLIVGAVVGAAIYASVFLILLETPFGPLAVVNGAILGGIGIFACRQANPGTDTANNSAHLAGTCLTFKIWQILRQESARPTASTSRQPVPGLQVDAESTATPDSAGMETNECSETMSSAGVFEADLLKDDAMLIFGPDAEMMGQRAVAAMAGRKLGGLLICRERLGTLEFPDVTVTGFILNFPHYIPSLRGGGKNEQQLRSWATQLLSGASYSAAAFGGPKLEWTGGAEDDFVLLSITWKSGHARTCLKLARAIEASFDRLAASKLSTNEVLAIAREKPTPPASGRKLSTSEVLALAREKLTPPAEKRDSQAAPAWRQLVTDCPQCGHRFKWIDKGSLEETPFCPNCGYDAVYNGKRRAVDPAEHPQPAVLPPQSTGLVRCDKCGATNRSTGAPIEQIVQFSLSRCQSCQRTFCTGEGCVGLIGANMPCPHCQRIAHYVAEDYDYV